MNTDRNAYNPVNIMERKKILAEFTDDDLKQAIVSGAKFKWKQHPSQYHAIIEELTNRGLIPKSR